MNLIAVSAGNYLKKYIDPGSTAPTAAEWSFDHGAVLYGVAFGPGGSIYCCGIRSTAGYTHHKVSSDGTLVWNADHGAWAHHLAVDSSGNCYVVGNTSSGVSLRKYDTDGNLLWSGGPNTTLYRVVLATDGYVYVSGTTAGGVNVWRYTTSGSLDTSWAMPGAAGLNTYGLAVNTDNVYVSHFVSSSKTTRVYDKSGTLLASYNHGVAVFAITVDGDGYYYTAGNRATGNISVRKYHPSHYELWTFDAINEVDDLAVDSSGNVFLAGFQSSPAQPIRKLDSSGSQVWYLDVGGWSFGIALLEVTTVTVTAPAVSIGVYLGLPNSARAFDTPAIPLALAMGLPDRSGGTSWILWDAPALATGAYPALPAIELEYAGGGQTQEFYRVYLGDLAIPARLAQIRKTDLGLEIIITCPTNTAALRSAIAARAPELLAVRWVQRLPGGVELSDYSAQAPLITVRQSPGEIRLTGQGTRVSLTQRTRTAQGITYQNMINGRARVRCVPDRYLEPGDTLVLPSGAGLIVADITYTIEPDRAVMEAAE